MYAACNIEKLGIGPQNKAVIRLCHHAMFFSQITKDEFFAEVLRDILLYVSRDLSDKVQLTQLFILTLLIAFLLGWWFLLG